MQPNYRLPSSPPLYVSATALVALCCLLLMGTVGSSAVAISLGLVVFARSGIVWLARPSKWTQVFLDYKLLWLLPAMNMLTAFTSQDPLYTVRIDLELIAITCCSIVLAKQLGPRVMVVILSLVTSVVIAAGAAFGGTELIYGQEDAALHGLFASKNYFALICGFGVLAGASVILEQRQPLLVRLLGAAGCSICGLLLLAARSVDAIGAVIVGMGVLIATLAMGFIGRRHRPFAVAAVAGFGVLILATVAVVVLQYGGTDAALAAVGKNSTLSGRSYLWLKAPTLIVQRPLLGYGYQAFWRQGFSEAEGLWRAMKVEGRGGFHFHNTYYETVIETGYVGLAVLCVTFGAMLIKGAQWAYRAPGAQSGFFLAVLFYLLSRSFLEVDIGGAFSLPTVLLIFAWVFSSDAVAAATAPRVRMPLFHQPVATGTASRA